MNTITKETLINAYSNNTHIKSITDEFIQMITKPNVSTMDVGIISHLIMCELLENNLVNVNDNKFCLTETFNPKACMWSDFINDLSTPNGKDFMKSVRDYTIHMLQENNIEVTNHD